MVIEQQRRRIEDAVTKAVNDVDRNHLRNIQKDLHYCAAKCCEDREASIDTVQNCVERCSAPLQRAQNFVQHELGEFQARLHRCVMQCNDDVKVKMPTSPSESEIAKYTTQFERCAVTCVDKHLDLIPSLMKTIREVLSKGPTNFPEV